MKDFIITFNSGLRVYIKCERLIYHVKEGETAGYIGDLVVFKTESNSINNVKGW
ncbi:hypothetical protein [Proteus phage J3S]